MADQGYGRDGRALMPMRYVAELFKDQTLAQIKNNLMTQRIWPYEVYPGYHIDNERRHMQGGWHSTGEGIKSFEGDVIEAGEDGVVTLSFRYNDYLQYVDIGVGAGRKAEDVDRAKKAYYTRRYVGSWTPEKGKTHRPALAMEFRHLQSRLENYVQSFYSQTAEFKILETFDGLNIPLTL